MGSFSIKQRDIFLRVILACTLIAVATFVIYSLYQKPSFEEIMEKPAAYFNQSKMKMIEKDIRFDSCIVFKNHSFQLEYTLVNHDSSSLNVKKFRKSIYAILLNKIKTDKNYIFLKENKANVIYRYKDKHGYTLCQLNFRPEQYIQ